MAVICTTPIKWEKSDRKIEFMTHDHMGRPVPQPERNGHSVRVTCPQCGFKALLDHDIRGDGSVHPSMDCPMCSFHEHVVLEGWTG